MTDSGPPLEHPPVPPPPARAGSEADARMWAAFAHLAGLSYLIGVPGVLGSLVVWLAKRDAHRLVDEHGKEAVNFQITLLLYNVAVVAIAFVTCGAGALLAPILAVLVIVLPIIATIRASDGRSYRYPLTLRLID